MCVRAGLVCARAHYKRELVLRMKEFLFLWSINLAYIFKQLSYSLWSQQQQMEYGVRTRKTHQPNPTTASQLAWLANSASIIETFFFVFRFVRWMNVCTIYLYFYSICVIELWDMGLKSFERFCCDFCAFIQIMEQQQQRWWRRPQLHRKLVQITDINIYSLCVCMLFAI